MDGEVVDADLRDAVKSVERLIKRLQQTRRSLLASAALASELTTSRKLTARRSDSAIPSGAIITALDTLPLRYFNSADVLAYITRLHGGEPVYTQQQIADAMRYLARKGRIVVEAAGARGLGGFLPVYSRSPSVWA